MSAQQPELVPKHIAIIPDGNRRWAKAHGLSSLEGHKKGGDVARAISRAVFKAGIPVMSIYAFSTENWNRTQDELQYLMELYLRLAGIEVKQATKDNIKIVLSGSKERLSTRILKSLEDVQAKTANNTGGILKICLNYGVQAEIVRAVQEIVREGVQPEDVTLEVVKQHLYTADLPPVDLVVRTSGEQRLSNFLLWDSAYAELIFVDKNWPDFDDAELGHVLYEYAQRQRRFGA